LTTNIAISTAPSTKTRPAVPTLSWRKKLCFTLVFFSSLFLFGEMAVRIFTRLTNRQRLYQLDAVAGYTCKPSLDRMPKRYDQHVFYYSTDSRGFRITAPPGAGRQGKTIVLLGDSFAFGFCVNDEDSLGYILSEESGRPVASLSAAGYSPDIYLPLLREYLRGIDSAASAGDVVLLICDNDFTDLIHRFKNHRPKAYFEKAESGYVEKPPQIGWLDRLMDNSDLAFTILTHILPAAKTTNTPYEQTPRLMCQITKQIHALCQKSKLPLTILLFEQLDKPQVTPELRDEFVRLCQDEGIKIEVITHQLRAGVEDFHTLLAVDNWHWSRAGNQKVSQIIRAHFTPRRAM
jgi:hypothetical protein